jgi:hypothetical protein
MSVVEPFFPAAPFLPSLPEQPVAARKKTAAIAPRMRHEDGLAEITGCLVMIAILRAPVTSAS